MNKYAVYSGTEWVCDVEAHTEAEALAKVPGSTRVELIKSG